MSRVDRGAWNLYVTEADGAGMKEPAQGVASGSSPSWSPDGTQLAYAKQGQIWTMNSNGTAKHPITTVRGRYSSPSWSPDGSKLAYTCSIAGKPNNGDICTSNADGSSQVDLTNYWNWDTEPTWSPDARKIAFASYRHGSWDVYEMSSAGSGLNQLTDDGKYEDRFPAWSPDGAHILFTRNVEGSPNLQIESMNADGSGLRTVVSEHATDFLPTWSPDGTEIAFAKTNYSRRGTRNSALVVMREDGSHERVIRWVQCTGVAWGISS